MESSTDADHEISLHIGANYILMMMTGQIIEGQITGLGIDSDTFYIKTGKQVTQYYYWDVDYGYPQELN